MPREEVLGKNCYAISHGFSGPCRPPNDPCPLAAAVKTKKSVTITHKHPARGDGANYVEIMVLPLMDEAGEVGRIIHISRDITEARRLGEELFHARKLEAVGKMAAGIGHDLNNIVGAMSSYISLILKDLPDNSPVREDMLELQKCELKVVKILKELMSAARKRVPEKKRLSPNTLIAGLEKLLTGLVGKNISVALNLGEDAPDVCADAGHLEEALLNLAANARDAMGEGGRLTITTSRGEGPVRAASLEDEVFYTAETCEILVEDTGAGITEKDLKNIFEPFFTTKPEGRGTGLGLSNLYETISQHRGRVEVASTVGKGTAFKITLPAAQKAE
ncbi:MAG: ATP-binding protein [Elusimicrobiota bacterium]|nr:ATP-binding protein [Elusimicrobiota bacterium]